MARTVSALVVSAALAAAGLVAWWRRRSYELEACGVPVVRIGLPIIGTARAFRRDPVKLLRDARAANPEAGAVSFDLLVVQVTIVWGEQEVADFHKTQRPILSTRPLIDDMLEPLFGWLSGPAAASWRLTPVGRGRRRRGSTSTERAGTRWKTSATSRPALESFLEVQARVAREHIQQRWAAGPFDAFEEAVRLVLRVNVLFFLGPAFEPHVDRMGAIFRDLERTASSPQLRLPLGLGRRRAERQQRAMAALLKGVWRDPRTQGLGGFLSHFPDFYTEDDHVHILVGMLFGSIPTTSGPPPPGHHRCLGEKYATYLIKLTVSLVLRRFSVTLAEPCAALPAAQPDIILGGQRPGRPLRLVLVPLAPSA